MSILIAYEEIFKKIIIITFKPLLIPRKGNWLIFIIIFFFIYFFHFDLLDYKKFIQKPLYLIKFILIRDLHCVLYFIILKNRNFNYKILPVILL